MLIKSTLATAYLVTTFLSVPQNSNQRIIEGSGVAQITQKSISGAGDIIFASPPLASNFLNKNELKVAILGDTGCRLRGKEIQNCNNPNEWPLKTISESIAKENPDFIIHVGDYHYRVSCTDPVKCKDHEGTWGYTWESWVADWFLPTKTIQNIPTVYVRGNHENCRRAWEHWQKYLSSDVNVPEVCKNSESLQIIDLGNILLVNLDTSWVSDESFDQNNKTKVNQALISYLKYVKEQIQEVNKAKNKEVWIVTHKPAYGAVPFTSNLKQVTDSAKQNKDSIIWKSGTPRLEYALEESGLNEVVGLYISGHIHNVQMVQGKHPIQIVAGESGTLLDSVGDYAENLIEMKNGSKAFIPTASKNQYGYLILKTYKNDKTKTLQVKNPQGLPEADCQFTNEEFQCSLIKN